MTDSRSVIIGADARRNWRENPDQHDLFSRVWLTCNQTHDDAWHCRLKLKINICVQGQGGTMIATAIVITLLSAVLYGLSEITILDAPSASRRTLGYIDDFEG